MVINSIVETALARGAVVLLFLFVMILAATLYRSLMSRVILSLKFCGFVVIFFNMFYYTAGCYHPPKARYADSVLTDLMSNQLDELFHIPITSASATFVIAGDFNTVNTGFLESDYGRVRIVNKPTHCNHIIDKFFTSRPEISCADVFASCDKTKHQAVYVEVLKDDRKTIYSHSRKFVTYDTRARTIDSLYFHLATS
jgi:hypothetical protein